MQQPSIILVGHVCIDHNVSEHTQYESWGSSVLYMARYWQQHGLEPTILTTYGQDFEQFAKTFSLYPTDAATISTLVFENKTKNGRRIQRCLHASTATPPELDDTARELLASAQVVIVAPLLANYSATFVRDVLQCTPDAIKIFAPQGYFRHVSPQGMIEHHLPPSIDKLIPLFDVTIYSQEDRETPFEYAKQVTKDTKAIVVVTQGPNGASIIQDGHMVHIPTIAVAEKDIIDSVGCGDTFTAGLAHTLLANKSIVAAVHNAHQAARAKLFHQPA